MRIIADNAIPFLEGRFSPRDEIIYLPGEKISPDDVKEADALIVRTRTKCNEHLLKGSKVKIVASATIGLDHIDKEWCKLNGIKIFNAPGCNAPGVAQYVYSSLFFSGFKPSCHTLGIVGFGNVGNIVRDWATQMGIKTLVTDDPRKNAGFKDIEYLPPDYVLANSDAVTLHVPFTKAGDNPTYHLIGEKELSLMKPGSWIVNSSRGGVVDEDALKLFLRNGSLKAIVDVWENEPEIDEELLSLVEIGTPHIAGYSEEGKRRGSRMALEAVAENLDMEISLNGLECYPSFSGSVTPSLIMNSYDPRKDYQSLVQDIKKFETLRNKYKYRHEPLFWGS